MGWDFIKHVTSGLTPVAFLGALGPQMHKAGLEA